MGPSQKRTRLGLGRTAAKLCRSGHPNRPASYNRLSMPPATETRLRVRYAETDQMGVVYYANHFVWMEVGRVDLCRACGFNYRDMEREDGIFLAVAEANCR